MRSSRSVHFAARRQAKPSALADVIYRHRMPLLTGTAWSAIFAAGLLSPLSMRLAAADCILGPDGNSVANNAYVCAGTNAANIPDFTALADGFVVGVGSYSGPTDVFATITVVSDTNAALEVIAGSNNGTITVTPGSSITAASGGGERHGLLVSATDATITLNIDGDIVSNDSSLTGGDLLRLTGTNQSTFIVNVGEEGLIGGGAGRQGIEVTNALSVQIDNDGAVQSGSQTTGNAIKIGDAISGAIAGSATITSSGTITGIGGTLSPVIYARAAGGTTINNEEGGLIGDASGGDSDLVIASTGSGGAIQINNSGTINGRMDFSLTSGAAAVTFNNYSSNSWNTSGVTNYTGNADLVNNEGGTLNTTGALADINFLGGDDILRNQDNDAVLGSPIGHINLDAGLTTFAFGSGGDRLENLEGSIITATNSSIFAFDNVVIAEIGPQGDDTFLNENDSEFHGAVSTTFLFGGQTDQFINQTGALFAVDGINTIDMGSGDDDFINQQGAVFTASGTANTFLFGSGADEMINRQGAEFTATGPLNTFLFGSGADEFVNERGGRFTLDAGILTGFNTMDFGDDVDSFVNDRGGEFRADGLLNSIVNLETMTNDRGGEIEFNGITLIGADNTSGLTSLTNTRGAYFEVEGASLINFTDGANTFDNTNGGEFASYGLNFLDFGDDTDTLNNTGGTIYSSDTLGLDVGLLTFLNLETFNAEDGTTDMQDGDIWDGIAMIQTNYHTDGQADHYIDAYLGGLLSAADFMAVGTVSGSGTTLVHVNDVNSGPGEYDPYGMAIVAVQNGGADINDFQLADGPIQKGFFSYDIYLDEGNSLLHPKCVLAGNDDCFIIASVEGQRSFELPVIAYGAQQMWHTSTGTWSDRTADLRSAFGGTGFGGGGADYVEPTAPMTAAGNVTPGIWGRVFGATQSRDFTNTSTPPFGLDGFDTTFADSFDQNIYGAMAGIDFGKESLSEQGNQAWIFGVFGGYTGSNLTFDNSDTDVDYQAGSIGAYVTYLNGGLFVDATIKADFGSMDYSSGGDSASANYTSIGGVVDAGYKMTMANGWFIEPKATLAYVNTSFDNMQVFGSDVEFSDGDSLRGRLGARVGTSMDRDGTLIEPYLEASIWNEFEGDYSASFFSNSTGFNPGFNADGVYGEVALGTSVVNASNGWSGFARGAVEFGEDSSLGLTGNLGIRKAW